MVTRAYMQAHGKESSSGHSIDQIETAGHIGLRFTLAIFWNGQEWLPSKKDLWSFLYVVLSF